MPIEGNTKIEIKEIDLSDNTSVAAGADKTETLQPPAGIIYKINKIWFDIHDPTGSGSGTHVLYMNVQTAISTHPSYFITPN